MQRSARRRAAPPSPPPKKEESGAELIKVNILLNATIEAVDRDDAQRKLAIYFSKVARAIDKKSKEEITPPFMDGFKYCISDVADFKDENEHEQYYGIEQDED